MNSDRFGGLYCLRFPRRNLTWRWKMDISTSTAQTAFIRVQREWFLRNVLGSSCFLQNTGTHLLDYTAEIHRRLKHKSILHGIRLPSQSRWELCSSRCMITQKSSVFLNNFCYFLVYYRILYCISNMLQMLRFYTCVTFIWRSNCY